MKKLIPLIFFSLTTYISSQTICQYTVQIANPPPCTVCCNGSITVSNVTYTCQPPPTVSYALITPTTMTIQWGGLAYWSGLCNGIYTVAIKFNNGGDTTSCGVTCQITWGYGSPTNLNEQSNNYQSGITLSPNPSKGFFNISLADERLIDKLVSLDVFDSSGQIIRKEEIVSGNNFISIQTDNLPTGIYFVRVRTNGHTIDKRLVVQ